MKALPSMMIYPRMLPAHARRKLLPNKQRACELMQGRLQHLILAVSTLEWLSWR